jgi:hypothetical protein
MDSKIKVVYENTSISVDTKIGRIISRRDAGGNKSFELVVGSIKSIRLGKKKCTVEIDRFYPQDIEDLMTDIDIHREFLSRGIMTVDTFFVADDDTLKHVEKWLEWAKNKSEKELSLLSSLEIDESEESGNE